MSTSPSLTEQLANIKLDIKMDIKSLSIEAAEKTPIHTLGNHVIAVVNSTDFTIRKVSVNGGPWADLTPVGRTCDSDDFHRCADGQKWAPLVVLDCGVATKIKVAMTNPQGIWYTTSWPEFVPNCQFGGSVIHLAP